LKKTAGLRLLEALGENYAGLALQYCGAGTNQDSTYLGTVYGLPPDASGSNLIQIIEGRLSLGRYFPVAFGVYGRAGFDVGADRGTRRALYFPREAGDEELAVMETSASHYENFTLAGVHVGLTMRPVGQLVLDTEIGIRIRSFGFLGSGDDGSFESRLSVPFGLSLGWQL